MKLNIDADLKKLIPPLAPDERALLEASIIAEGCRDAIITWNDTIVDGHNRYEICTKHGIPFRTEDRDFESADEVKIWMIDNQKGRRNLTDGWKFELAQERKRILNQKGKQTQGIRNDLLSNIDKKIEIGHNTQKEIAADLGWSTGKVAMADVVWKQADDQVKEKVKAGEVSINEAYQEIKREEKKHEREKQIEEVRQKIEQEEITAPSGKFDVIAIDPPWAYDEKGGFSSDQHDPDGNRGGVDYPTMTVEQIGKIDLPSKDDSVLFLWTTHAFLRDSFTLLDQWGYTYKATIVWDKERMGMGRTIRLQCEFCLLAIKGRPIIEGASERDIIREARREHSRKPEAFYAMVERMCMGRKLDYFSREQRQGWDTYGAEAGKF
jgi:N6-adenosine-specific RNA methylase IME4